MNIMNSSIDPLNGLNGKKILLGITGGIAAYKNYLLIREFIKLGAEVKVITTPSSLAFVNELTLSTLSKNIVISETFSANGQGTWHIDLSQWADLFIIAPATMNTIAKIAYGFCDNPVTILALARRCPLIVCPAADEDMYVNPVSGANIDKLEHQGVHILKPESGELASGLTGIGRLPELSKIIDYCETVILGYSKDLEGKRILVTAGPTFEDIDPVRFIGNRSSGKMGYAIARAAHLRGAIVTLISGPSSALIYPEIVKKEIRTADQMFTEVSAHLASNDILIMAAAVADYTPTEYSNQKIKKGSDTISLELKKTKDVLRNIEKSGKFIVGFALESENETENAKKKLVEKGIDMIILNSALEDKSGFEVDTNKVKILFPDKDSIEISTRSKFQVAHRILDEIAGANNG